MLTHQPAESPPLAAHHDRQRGQQTRLEMQALGIWIRAHDPKSRGFQILKGAGKVGHLGYGKIFEGAGRTLCDRGGESGGAMLRDDHAVGARTLGRSNDGTQVGGILHAVQHDDKRGLPLRAGTGEDVVHRSRAFDRGEGDDALVVAGGGQRVQAVGIHGLDHDASPLCFMNYIPHDSRVPEMPADEDLSQWAAAAQCFQDGTPAGNRLGAGLASGVKAQMRRHERVDAGRQEWLYATVVR